MSDPPNFSGPAYSQPLDQDRLAGQHERIRDLMSDGEWRTLQEIKSVTHDPESSVSAQLRHLRKPRFGSHDVDKRRRGGSGSWEYKVYPAGTNTRTGQPGAATGEGLTRAEARRVREDLFAALSVANAHNFTYRYRPAVETLLKYLEDLAGDSGKVCSVCSGRVARTYDGMWCPEHGLVEVKYL